MKLVFVKHKKKLEYDIVVFLRPRVVEGFKQSQLHTFLYFWQQFQAIVYSTAKLYYDCVVATNLCNKADIGSSHIFCHVRQELFMPQSNNFYHLQNRM